MNNLLTQKSIQIATKKAPQGRLILVTSSFI